MTLKFDSLHREAVGDSNFNSNDPIAAFIGNLKNQLNMKTGSGSSSASSKQSETSDLAKDAKGGFYNKKFKKL